MPSNMLFVVGRWCAVNQLIHDGTQALTYDANGNLTNDGTNGYVWDHANRLLAHAGHSYAYDGDGRRISQTVSSVVTQYLLDIQPGLSVVLSQTVDDTDTTHYVHTQRGIHAVQEPAGEWMHPITDALGSIRGYIDPTGGVLSTVHYGEWGVPSAGIVGPAFTGEWRDANTLQNHRARYYAPGLAVWTALDPWEGVYQRPMSLNGYSWVEGDPVNRVDPSGEAVPAALVAIAVAVVAVLPLAIAGQQLVKNSLCVLFSDLPTCRDPFNNPTTILESICVPAIQAVMSVAQPQAIPVPQAPPYGDDFPSLDDLTNPTMSLLLLWLLMQQLTRARPTARDRTDEDTAIRFYRGNTYYDLLRTREDPIESVIEILSARQRNRDIEQGVFYTSTNRDVALYFAFFEAGNRPGQGGVGLMTIELSNSDFRRIADTYGIVHNQPIEGLPSIVPQPHVETLFPFSSLPDLFSVSQINVQLIPNSGE